MKLYHYIPKDNTIITDGLLSFAKSKNVNLKSYLWRAPDLKNQKDVINWMESCFVGRSRGIRFFTEPIKWYPHSIKVLKDFVENNILVSVDIERLDADNFVEAVYVSPPIGEQFPECIENPESMYKCDEIYERLSSVQDIDYSPLNWNICDDKLGRRFAYIRYYFIVFKDGIIPPQYITIES